MSPRENEHRRDFPRRPPRLTHISASVDSPLYFLTCGTWNRQHLLGTDAVHTSFREHCERLASRGVAVGRYVIMPDHMHLFVRIGREQTLGLTVKHLKERITKTIRKEHPGVTVWQPGFFDHLLRNDESYAQKWEYVRENPLREGLASHHEDWPYQGEIVTIDRA